MLTTIIKKKNFGLYAHLVLKAPRLAKRAKPGQFVEVKVACDQAAFWRKPFCICRAYDEHIELLVKEVGPGSAAIRQMRLGEQLDMLGPLGNHFSLKPIDHALMVGGGFGVAPLLFLAEQLKEKTNSMTVIIGGRCKDDLILRKELQATGAKLLCATNDGSFGQTGLVTTILKEELSCLPGNTKVFAAGPWGMMAAVAALTDQAGVACQVSLEEVMACGLGVCNGCVVEIDGRYQRVCKDGPVADASKVKWEK